LRNAVSEYGISAYPSGRPRSRRAFGAIERAQYAAILTWPVVIGVACATGQL
jgi:hypothetical protein